MLKKTCVIASVIFYENGTNNAKTVYMALSWFLYYFIKNYVWINYLCCKLKTLSIISPDRIFEQTGYNILPGIGIIELLMNIVSCHGFT